jgi:hypothetical protein
MLITIIPLYLKCSCWWKLLSRKHSDNSGYSGKLAFNAASYKDKLYIGLNLNLIL